MRVWERTIEGSAREVERETKAQRKRDESRCHVVYGLGQGGF